MNDQPLDLDDDDGQQPSLNPTISTIAAAHETATQDFPLRKILSDIQSDRWAKQVGVVRAAYAAGGKDGAAEPKKKLPGVLFSGTFKKRSAKELIQHSGLICADLDELGPQMEATFEQVCADPHTLACFRSPTGTGLKVLFRCDPTKPHIESFKAAEQHMLTQFGVEIDQACKDVSRICFVSHDPELFQSDDAELLPYPSQTVEFEPQGLNPRTGLEVTPGDDYDQRGDFASLLISHDWEKVSGGWRRPGKTTGLSATFDKIPGRFYVFSSSTEFEAQHTYRPWHVYAILEHGGDFSAAARKLGESGYGHQKTRQQVNLERVAGPAPEPVHQLTAKPLPDFALPPKGDNSILIGDRWLSRGDIAILASTSGMGKSSFSLQAATAWGTGQKLLGGFDPHRPLKSLFFQAEDGEGDVAEVMLSLRHAMKWTPAQEVLVRQNVLVVTDRVHRGKSFVTELKRQLALHKPDLVWINPLLAFIGGDVNDSTDVGTFLREQLNALNEPAAFAYIIIHHTAKPPKEKAKRQWNEVMYEMAGSADLTNAARAILALQATDSEGHFNLIGAKRGIRAGLTTLVPGTINPEIKFYNATSTVAVRHSTDKFTVGDREMRVIHWELDDAPPAADGKPAGGRPSKYQIEEFFQWIPKGQDNAKPAGQIHRDTGEATGISSNGLKYLLHKAKKDGAVQLVTHPARGPCYFLAV